MHMHMCAHVHECAGWGRTEPSPGLQGLSLREGPHSPRDRGQRNRKRASLTASRACAGLLSLTGGRNVLSRKSYGFPANHTTIVFHVFGIKLLICTTSNIMLYPSVCESVLVSEPFSFLGASNAGKERGCSGLRGAGAGGTWARVITWHSRCAPARGCGALMSVPVDTLDARAWGLVWCCYLPASWKEEREGRRRGRFLMCQSLSEGFIFNSPGVWSGEGCYPHL